MAVTAAVTRPRLRLPMHVQDALLALGIALFQVRGTLLVSATEHYDRTLSEPAGLGYLLLAGSGLALLGRRRWPVQVFAVVAAISAGYYAAGYPDGPGWIALFVAVYTLTAQGDGRRSLQIAGLAKAVLIVVWLLNADLWPLTNAGWLFFRIVGFVMAAALGESVRTRRVILAEAQERAERAERTREEEARRQVDAERLRIAREVHDTVAHAIAVINVHAGVTAHVLEKRPAQARDALLTIEQTSARALRELRAALGMLRDVNDDGPAPTPGLGQIGELERLAREAGLDVTIRLLGQSRDVPSAVDHAAYRVVQEAITNVIRHAGPAHVTITLSYGPDDLHVVVVDDGRGAPGGLPATAGRGIAGMRERCALLGGRIVAGPRAAGGFQVDARLPLQPVPEASVAG